MPYRPFQNIATATLVNVVKRDKYSRFGREFETALQAELELRRLAERRSR